MATPPDTPVPSSCPIDPQARRAWLESSRTAPPEKLPSALPNPSSCDSSSIDQRPTSPSLQTSQLDRTREISSIPRAASSTSQTHHPHQPPANNERETGQSTTGNWIYPSEEMFFNAMRRKAYDPRREDMKTIVPIHNAVNERAWREIREWERGRGAERCGGPRLHSFSGNSRAMTPKARLNTVLGYSAPFDRHDWVVDRCGARVEYVIDFYAGKKDASSGEMLSFYLDVRPKLNSWEGVKMRVGRVLGIL